MNTAQQLTHALTEEVHRRLIGESLPRIEKCLTELTEEEIWYRPNEHSNSVGNLVLHLCGNVSQYVLSGLGGKPDLRQRQQEFDEKGPLPTQTLLDKLHAVMKEVEEVLQTVTSEELLRKRSVQGFEESGLSILVHVTEHFSYHTGQITYFVKWRKNRDMGYYAGLDLDQTGN